MSTEKHMVIIGGGLAGLSAGCYGRASGFATTIVEHGMTLGGVCTAWERGPYTVDGCIHWLTGGPFDMIYRELGILPKVPTHVLDHFATYRNVRTGESIAITRDLAAFGEALKKISPQDADEIARLIEGAADFASLQAPLEAPELRKMHEGLAQLWEMRHHFQTLAHFRKPIGTWLAEHIHHPTLRRMFAQLVPPEAPALFLLMMLGYLARGYLSRPNGGSGRFRDALIESYQQLGGLARLQSTVEEILVQDDRASGVRLLDGTIIEADLVVSTASSPETVLHLLGGRYGAAAFRKRMQAWKLFEPIVLASYGVATPLTSTPPTLIIDGITPLDVGGRSTEHLYVRTYNDDALMAPAGHTVVQLMAGTTYDYWAKCGDSYATAKATLSETLWSTLAEQLPIANARKMTDLATPLTFWNQARSWRGAFEGWMPSADAIFGHVKKTVPGLGSFYMAGQWMEPGGGVPMALMSGRQVTQLICADADVPFAVPALAPGR